MTTPIVLKIGGNDLDNPQFIDALANTVKNSSVPVVIVHGGGKEISQMQQHLGLEPRYVDGLRVTDEAALYVAQMVLCGIVNKRIVQALQRGGVEAQGMSGMDRGLIQAQKMHHPAGDLGRVGEITHVRRELLTELLNDGVTPVIAPISLGDDGAYNVNADHAAGAVARALGASKVVFVTNVPGVLHNDALVSQLTPDCAHNLINDGIIHGGMLPKVSTALKLLSNDVPEVMITNLDGVLSGMGTAIAYGA